MQKNISEDIQGKKCECGCGYFAQPGSKYAGGAACRSRAYRNREKERRNAIYMERHEVYERQADEFIRKHKDVLVWMKNRVTYYIMEYNRLPIPFRLVWDELRLKLGEPLNNNMQKIISRKLVEKYADDLVGVFEFRERPV